MADPQKAFDNIVKLIRDAVAPESDAPLRIEGVSRSCRASIGDESFRYEFEGDPKKDLRLHFYRGNSSTPLLERDPQTIKLDHALMYESMLQAAVVKLFLGEEESLAVRRGNVVCEVEISATEITMKLEDKTYVASAPEQRIQVGQNIIDEVKRIDEEMAKLEEFFGRPRAAQRSAEAEPPQTREI